MIVPEHWDKKRYLDLEEQAASNRKLWKQFLLSGKRKFKINKIFK